MDVKLPYSIRADWRKSLLFIPLFEALPLTLAIVMFKLHYSNWAFYSSLFIFLSSFLCYWFFTFELRIYPEGLSYTELFNEIQIPFTNISTFNFENAILDSKRHKIRRLAIQTNLSEEPFYLNMSMVSKGDREILANTILAAKPSLKELIDIDKILEEKIVEMPKKKLTWEGVVVLIFLFLFLIVFNIFFRVYSLLDYNAMFRVMIIGLIIGLEFFQPIWYLLAGGMLIHSGVTRRKWKNITNILKCLSLSFFMFCIIGNAVFDKSELICHNEFVTSKFIGSGRTSSYYACFKSWRPNHTSECVQVPSNFYNTLTPNLSYMRICTKSGFLGWEWVCWPPKDGIHNMPQSISELTQDIARNPDDAIDYFNRGLSYYKEGKRTNAIADLKKAIELDPQYPKAALNLEFIYNERGVDNNNFENYYQALSDFTQAIDLDPNKPLVYQNRAIVYYELKEYDKAWADVHKAEELGYTIRLDLINLLKKASGMDK